jgi:hypothetical protein
VIPARFTPEARAISREVVPARPRSFRQRRVPSSSRRLVPGSVAVAERLELPVSFIRTYDSGMVKQPPGGRQDARSRRRGDPERGLALASFGLAVAASMILLLAPLGTSVEPVRAGEKLSSGRVTHESLVHHDGWSVAIPLAVPVAISGSALLAGRHARRRPHRAVAAFLLTAFVVVGIPSIGIYYLPAAGAMFGAAVSSSPSGGTR